MLRSSLTSPGEVVMLEVKVPESTDTGHQLSVDTKQLQSYLDHRLPVFYVLPVPRWSGSLNPETTSPAPASGWWRQQSGNWFGEWTYVLSAADVADQLPMEKAKPVLYTVPHDGGNTNGPPETLKDAFPWQLFWREVWNCGPDGTVRWRITEDRPGRMVVTNLADEEEIDVPVDEEQAGFGTLQDQLLVQQEDNLVIVHIDEKALQTE